MPKTKIIQTNSPSLHEAIIEFLSLSKTLFKILTSIRYTILIRNYFRYGVYLTKHVVVSVISVVWLALQQ